MNSRGDYEFIKRGIAQLELKHKFKLRIAYYQNQSDVPKDGHCNITHIIKLINCLDRNKYKPENIRTPHPTRGFVSAAQLKDEEKERIALMMHLLPQALWIEQKLCEHIHKYFTDKRRMNRDELASVNTKKNMFLPDNRYSYGFSVPADFALPIVASYRVFLDEKYRWVIPFEDFAEDYLQKVWDDFFKSYLIRQKLKGGVGVSVQVERDTSLWSSIYALAQQYLNKYLAEKVAKQEKASPRENLVLTARPSI
jgi:hypothetical protein